MIVSELVAKLGFDYDERDGEGFTRALANFKIGVLELGKELYNLGKALTNTLTEVAMRGDEINTLSEVTGVSAKSLQELSFAAESSSTDLYDLSTGLRGLSKNIYEATHGNEELGKSFASLGIELKDSVGNLLPTDAVLMQISDRFKALGPGQEIKKTALSMQLFGKSGAALIPFLNKGSEGLGELRAQANELGVVLPDSVVASGAAFDSAEKSFAAAFRGLKYAIGAPLIEPFTKAMQRLVKIFIERRPDIESFGRSLANVFEWVLKMLGKLPDFDALLRGIGATLASVSAIFLALKLEAVAASAFSLSSALSAIGAALLPIATIVAPIALLALILDDIWVGVQGGESYFKDIMDWANSASADDSPFVYFLKTVVAVLTDLSLLPGVLADSFSSMFTKMKDALLSIPFLGKILDLLGTGAKTAFDFGVQGAGVVLDVLSSNRANMAAIQNTTLPRFGGGAASPEAAASYSPGSVVNSTSSVVNVTVPPGADAQEIGRVVQSKVEEVLYSQNSNALASFAGTQ